MAFEESLDWRVVENLPGASVGSVPSSAAEWEWADQGSLGETCYCCVRSVGEFG